MADLTREELAEWKRAAEKHLAAGRREVKLLDHEDLIRLLSMAERAVSEKTLRLAAAGFAEDGGDYESWKLDLVVAVTDDLRPAAARLAAKGGEGG